MFSNGGWLLTTNGGNNETNSGNDGEQAGDPSGKDGVLSLDAILELLAHHYRRWLLSMLVGSSDNVVTFDDVLDELVGREHELTGELPGRDNLMITLYHVHLPKLEEASVVEFDVRSERVRYWENERLEALLAGVQDADRPFREGDFEADCE